MTDTVALLRAAIAASGLSNRKYATDILTRDERTIRRWLSGKTSIPRAGIEKLTAEGHRPLKASRRRVA